MGQIANYRQPMVTAAGIFLGFLLNFGTAWVAEAFTKHIVRDIIVGTSTIACITLLMVVLYRMLNMRYPPEKAETYYQRTLRLFLLAISLPFVSFILIVIHRLVKHGMPDA